MEDFGGNQKISAFSKFFVFVIFRFRHFFGGRVGREVDVLFLDGEGVSGGWVVGGVRRGCGGSGFWEGCWRRSGPWERVNSRQADQRQKES